MNTRQSVLDSAQRAWVREWWRALQPREPGSSPVSPALTALDRGARARLRRRTDADDLLQERAVYLLAERLIALDAQRQWKHFGEVSQAYVWIALAAGVLAHATSELSPSGSGVSLARQLGRAVDSDRPPMSELRFKRLLKAHDELDLLRQWRRAVKLAGGEADVAQLADDLVAWQIEQTGSFIRASDSIKFRWAYDYYLNKREQKAAGEPASIKELST